MNFTFKVVAKVDSPQRSELLRILNWLQNWASQDLFLAHVDLVFLWNEIWIKNIQILIQALQFRVELS